MAEARLNTTDCVLLNQPDKQKSARLADSHPVPGEFQITLKSKGFKRC